MKNKILSIILCISMVFSIFPYHINAENIIDTEQTESMDMDTLSSTSSIYEIDEDTEIQEDLTESEEESVESEEESVETEEESAESEEESAETEEESAESEEESAESEEELVETEEESAESEEELVETEEESVETEEESVESEEDNVIDDNLEIDENTENDLTGTENNSEDEIVDDSVSNENSVENVENTNETLEENPEEKEENPEEKEEIIELSVIEQLLSVETLNGFLTILLNSENREIVLNFTSEEIIELADYVNLLYANIIEKTEEDTALKDEILDTLSVLPNGDVDLGAKTLNYLEWSGEQAGVTLTTDVVLVGDTYMTSIITIPEDTEITIDLNGYMLKGSGSSSVIRNNGTLTIKDSRPDFNSHIFQSRTDGPWELDENGDVEIVGGIITGGWDKAANSSGGGAIKQGSNKYNNILNIEGGTFVGNYAARAGGAIYGGAVIMYDGRIIGNFANKFAGGVSLSGNFTMYGGIIEENNTNPDSANNNPNNSGFHDFASIVIGQQSGFVMEGGKVVGNVSTVYNTVLKPKFILNDGEVIGNFRINNGLNAQISGGSLNGHIYLNGGSVTVSDTALIYGGYSENGGAITINSGDVIMTGGTIEDTSAVNGGAIYINNGNFSMSGGVIQNCNATGDGGAVYVYGGDILMTGGVIQNNMSENNGGAIFVESDSRNVNITIESGTIANNTAEVNGGAVGANILGLYEATINVGLEACKCLAPELHLTGECPKIYNNTAGISGGAFYCYSVGDTETTDIEDHILFVNLYCCNIYNNTALKYSASNSLHEENGYFTIYAGEIDAGFLIDGGVFIDLRPKEYKVTLRFWANYEGSEEYIEIETSKGHTMFLPDSIFEYENHLLTGWSKSPTDLTNYVPINGEYTVEDSDTYIDFYAVWDAQTSFILYIPESIEINEYTGVGEMVLDADLYYFGENTDLTVYLSSDFEMSLTEDESVVLPYKVFTSEYGIKDAISDGGVAATFQYNNTSAKTLTVKLTKWASVLGKYIGNLTFTTDFYEGE